MRLDEAYRKWGEQSENRELYKNTKEIFRKATWMLPTNQQCGYYTLEVIARAFAATTLAPSDRTKAASVICHVLNYAHIVDPDNNPKPNFGFSDITDFKGKDMVVLEESEPEVQEEQPSAADDAPEGQKGDAKPFIQQPKQVAMLDPKTLKVLKVWESAHAVTKTLGIQNIQRAIERHGLAGGYFWCRPGEEKGFKPMGGLRPGAAVKPAEKKVKPVEEKPAPVPENTYRPLPDIVDEPPTLADIPDEELLAEIRRRGWKGQLTITKVVEF